jgi:hypothetical protein
MSKVRFVGLMSTPIRSLFAVAEHEGEVRSQAVIPNRLESIRKLLQSSVLQRRSGPVTRAGQIPAAARQKAGRDESLDKAVPGVDRHTRTVRSASAGSHTTGLMDEVKHVAERIVKLEKAIDEAVRQSPPQMKGCD